jgi:hypothetical protein
MRTIRHPILRTLAMSVLAAGVGYGLLGSGAQAQRIAQSGTSAVDEFRRLLPPVASVPWLDTRLQVARAALGLPQAGSLEALLLRPTPATNWPSAFKTEAANLRGPQR